jgi:hypothetical protein
MPSHQTPPSGVSATFVKIVFRDQRGHRVRVRLHRGAGRHAEETRLGIDRVEPAVGAGLQPRDVVAEVHTFQPCSAEGLRGTIIAKLVLPQALGNAAET